MLSARERGCVLTSCVHFLKSIGSTSIHNNQVQNNRREPRRQLRRRTLTHEDLRTPRHEMVHKQPIVIYQSNNKLNSYNIKHKQRNINNHGHQLAIHLPLWRICSQAYRRSRQTNCRRKRIGTSSHVQDRCRCTTRFYPYDSLVSSVYQTERSPC